MQETAPGSRKRITPKVWWYFLAFVLLVGMYRCYPRTPDLRVRSDWDGERVTGTAQNTTRTRTFFNVRIEFVLLDANKEVLSTVTTRKDGELAPGEQWAFDIEASAVGAESHRRRTMWRQTRPKPLPFLQE